MVDVVVKGILNLSIILNTTARDSRVSSFTVVALYANTELCNLLD